MTSPTLCLPPGGVPALRERARAPELKPLADRLITRCDRWLALPPIQVPPKPSTRDDRTPRELMRSRGAQGRIVSLACAWHLTGNRAYLDRCWTEIEYWLDAWTSWTDPYHGTLDHYDLMVGEVALGLGLAYDWLKADLPPERAAKLRDHLGRRALDLYLKETSGPEPVWWFKATHNWNSVCNGGAIVAALALGAEYPRSEEVVTRALANMGGYLNALHTEGGCDEGLGYWQYGMRYAVAAIAALEDSGRDVSAWTTRRGFLRTGRFPLAFAPGDVPVSWGDAASKISDPCLYRLAGWSKDPDLVRFEDRRLEHFDLDNENWQPEALALSWRPLTGDWLPTAGSPVDLGPGQVWREIGWSCFPDSWETPTFVAGLKCGDLGANHTHLDNLGLLLWARGEWLAYDLGAPTLGKYGGDYFSDKRWDMYIVKTAGHNAPTIGGRGQLPETKGTLEPLPDVSPRVTGAVGDATANYGGPVRRARRHLAVVDRAVAVLLDEVETAGSLPVEWRLHAPCPFTVTGSRASMTGIAGRARLDVLLPQELATVTAETDPGHVAPEKADHVLLAVTPAARSRVIPAVLFASAPGDPPPQAGFALGKDRIDVTLDRPGGRTTLTWRATPAGWTFAEVR